MNWYSYKFQKMLVSFNSSHNLRKRGIGPKEFGFRNFRYCCGPIYRHARKRFYVRIVGNYFSLQNSAKFSFLNQNEFKQFSPWTLHLRDLQCKRSTRFYSAFVSCSSIFHILYGYVKTGIQIKLFLSITDKCVFDSLFSSNFLFNFISSACAWYFCEETQRWISSVFPNRWIQLRVQSKNLTALQCSDQSDRSCRRRESPTCVCFCRISYLQIRICYFSA